MMSRRKGMKLDQALKLYIALYCICFLLTWLISIPMLIHVTPQSECLLFVTPYIKYGNPAACNIVGIVPFFVAISAAVLIVLHVIQLRSLKNFLRKPGPHSSDYHHRPTHIFWRMVIFHFVVTLVVLTITAIVTAGYHQTCQNLYYEVRNTVRSRFDAEKWGAGTNLQNNEIIDVFSNDRSINRYVNPVSDVWGNNAYEHGITCRNILTDPEVHSQLKTNHAANPHYKQYYGFWYGQDIADVGNIRYYSYRNNMILEMCIAASWISFVLWSIMLVLMVKERHHIKAHLTDESMFGSEFGGSRRSASRMSNQSFDRSSRVSVGQRSRGGSRPPFDQMSYQGSVQGSTRSGQGRRANGGQGNFNTQPIQHPIIQQNTLLDYFNSTPNDTEVDIDAALQEDSIMNNGRMPESGPLDTSFGSGGLPDNLLNATEDFGGPIALGDEVSQANSLEPQFDNGNDEGHIFSSNPVPMNIPNRQTGRRGGGRPGSKNGTSSRLADYQPYNPRSYTQQTERRQAQPYTHQKTSTNPSFQMRSPEDATTRDHQMRNYRTSLGHQSMI